ncbi:peptidase domain-containing ABC transporter [Nonomuraea wenchangensis]
MAPRTRPARVRTVRQAGMAECGAACLAMVLTAHGRHTSLTECRELLGVGRDGSNLRAIGVAARGLGMRVRGLRVKVEHLREVALPAVGHWGDAHYMVIEQVTRDRVHVVDPGAGRRRLTWEEADRGLSGVVLEMVPGPGFRTRRPHVGDRLRVIRTALTGGTLSLAVAVLLTLLLHGALVGVVLTVSAFVRQRVAGAADPALALQAAAWAIVALLCALARRRGLTLMTLRMQSRLSERLFEHLLHLPFRYFEANSAAELSGRVSAGVALRQILAHPLPALVLDGAIASCYLVALTVAAPAFAAPVLVVVSLGAVLLAYAARPVREASQWATAGQAETYSAILHAFRGIETVKGMGRERDLLNALTAPVTRQESSARRHLLLETHVDACVGFLRAGGLAALALVVLEAVIAPGGNPETAVLFGAAALFSLETAARIAAQARKLPVASHYLGQAEAVLREPTERPSGPLAAVTPVAGGAELRGVSFRYSDNSDWSLRDVDLRLLPGSKIGLVGATGSGKSTLAKLILGLHAPTVGSVLIDGHRLDSVDPAMFRGGFGFVPQEPRLFTGTVRSNIAMGRPGVPQDEIERAARRAQLHDEIAAMPLGYDTPLSEEGAWFSGGQLQRLTIARALLGEPPLVVLDEATSHLDTMTEARLDRALAEMQCTRVVIAHRMSAVRDADLIVVLDRGRVVEHGTHEELMALGGTYRALTGAAPMTTTTI